MGPLTGLKIIELAGIGAGPHCAMMLADLGADVVRVDRPVDAGLGVAIEPKYDLILRGRRSLAIDLKSEAGRNIVLKMIDQADAVIESFRPGVVERMGLGPDVCIQRNPKLVYARLTGWGQDGPYAQMAGHDINYIALSGVLHAIGARGGPPVPPLNLVGDFGGGAVYCAFGIVSALLSAQRTGKGQVVDAAMVDGAAALLTMVVGFRRGGIWSESRGDNIVDGGAPYYATYETSDNKYIAIGAMEQKFYDLLLQKLDLSDDAKMRPHTDRSLWSYQREKFAAIFKQRSRLEWCELLEGTDTCFSPVLSIDEAADHPHIKARGTYRRMNDVVQPAPNPRFSLATDFDPMAPAALGEHSSEVLREFGLPSAEIEALIESGTVFQMGEDKSS